MPPIISFLNYVPIHNGEPTKVGEQLILYRMMNGISIKKLAKQIQIDELTIKRIEKIQSAPGFMKRTRQKLEFLLNC